VLEFCRASRTRRGGDVTVPFQPPGTVPVHPPVTVNPRDDAISSTHQQHQRRATRMSGLKSRCQTPPHRSGALPNHPAVGDVLPAAPWPPALCRVRASAITTTSRSTARTTTTGGRTAADRVLWTCARTRGPTCRPVRRRMLLLIPRCGPSTGPPLQASAEHCRPRFRSAELTRTLSWQWHSLFD
jgi:hypothetical protein